MEALTPESARDYLIASGRLDRHAMARIAPLAWGVSNIVLRVDVADGSAFVLKQAQPQLRTKIEWLSRCERIYREADVLRVLAPRLSSGVIPRVLFEDRPNFVLGIEAIRPDHVVWKGALLRGEADPQVAETLGSYLATIHRTTFGQRTLLPDADDWSLFDELRIDPFYRYIARVHTELQPAVTALLDEMAAHRECLVHADFSPKNVLFHPDGVSLVDFETAHWGDPAFDVGFFLSHLLLKSLLPVLAPGAIAGLTKRFWDAYQQGLAQTTGPDFAAISQRSVRHLAGCLLARIDGKSPVDYLPHDWQRTHVRTLSHAWLLDPPPSINHCFYLWFSTLPESPPATDN